MKEASDLIKTQEEYAAIEKLFRQFEPTILAIRSRNKNITSFSSSVQKNQISNIKCTSKIEQQSRFFSTKNTKKRKLNEFLNN